MDKSAPPVLHYVNRRPTADSWYVLPSGSDGRMYQESATKSLKNRIDRKGLIGDPYFEFGEESDF